MGVNGKKERLEDATLVTSKIERDHEPRNSGGLKKLEEARRGVLP